jgi:heme/copper-type cytochrome/quinol oxidase subunit 2
MKRVAGLLGCQVAKGLRAAARQLGNPATLQPLLALLLLFAPQLLSACPTCYGDPASPMTKGSNNAILFMLGIIGLVQVGFVGLFITFWRRARALRRRRESLRLIEGGAR